MAAVKRVSGQGEKLSGMHYVSRYEQSIVVSESVMRHMDRYRQITISRKEAGGQLFGTYNDNTVRILTASGPYRGDERSRYYYRSNPKAAQKAIDAFAEQGLFYLGEWHTHPQEVAVASGADRATISSIVRRSTLRLTSLMMLIQGQAIGAAGLAVYSHNGGTLSEWRRR